ncbi:MAG: hypothetical protein RL308_956 [Bacteroidota bacterium]
MKDLQNLYTHYMNETIKHVYTITNSKKEIFDFKEVVKFKDKAEPRFKTLIEAFQFLKTNPLNKNDYFKFVNSYYKHGTKLNEKYFRHDLNKLYEYYKRVDKDKDNPFNYDNFQNYVLYMFLKMYGVYEAGDDLLFKVKEKDHREYNPLANIPSVLRGTLPFEVKEYDIKRAFPTFIDIELGTDFRKNVYEKISKSNFAMFLNSNKESKVTIQQARKGLEKVYKDLTDKVLTIDRYNEKGRAYRDFVKYESEYINKFVTENKLENYARLHDGIYLLKGKECEHTIFDKVEFTIKECIKPKIESNIISFYSVNFMGEVFTCRTMYADFLKQENFIRLSTPDDKIQLLKNSNNVVDFFNHRTDMVSFLENEINEPLCCAVRETIAKDNNTLLMGCYTLIDPIELNYYKDSKKRFGLPFLNGFCYFDSLEKMSIKQKEYSQVKGFFTPHPIQKREFQYTDEVGNFELFIQRISVGTKNIDLTDVNQKETIQAFNSMIGYLCHNFKSFTESPCIILTDEGANDSDRKGGRGKTLLSGALKEVVKTMIKGGLEFQGKYIHNFADLDKSYSLYSLDDIPAGFNYNDLYTNITGGINVQPKGKKGQMIEFEDSPKFLITTNYLFRYDEENASTNRRFIEYKIKPYYNISHTPKMEFNQTFFEDWDATEWNKFYSYIFRCVHSFLKDGLQRIAYDKTDDNFRASFGTDAKLSEMARIIDVIININKDVSFNVSDFLSIYKHFENPLKNELFFNAHNSKKLIDIYLGSLKENKYLYVQREKRWMR